MVPRRRRRGGDDADGDSLVIGSVTQPDGGTVLITGDTTLTYEPDLGFCDEGPDTFTYTLNGGDTATVSVTVQEGTWVPRLTDPVRRG